jgi:ribosome-associated translation inhibitor RaiA
MNTPLQITFRHMDPSSALEDDIRHRVADLEAVFDRLVDCRVSIEAPHQHHRQGQLYKVLVDIGIPGDRIVVDRSPDDAASHADAYVAVRDAFLAARRMLEKHVGRRRSA